MVLGQPLVSIEDKVVCVPVCEHRGDKLKTVPPDTPKATSGRLNGKHIDADPHEMTPPVDALTRESSHSADRTVIDLTPDEIPFNPPGRPNWRDSRR